MNEFISFIIGIVLFFSIIIFGLLLAWSIAQSTVRFGSFMSRLMDMEYDNEKDDRSAHTILYIYHDTNCEKITDEVVDKIIEMEHESNESNEIEEIWVRNGNDQTWEQY